MSALYEKLTSSAGKVSYKLHVPAEPSCKLSNEMTEGQLISAIGGLAVLAIHGYQMLIPDHKLIARKVAKVNNAVLEMYSGTGQPIDDETVEFVIRAWNLAMMKLDGEGI